MRESPARRARPVALDEAAALADTVRKNGGTVVFTNGVFDLIHPGHIRYLTEARSLGDVLLVGINSDRSVRAIKGPERPITPAHERAEILLALTCVDAVVVFDDETPQAAIDAIGPDVLVKGADWAADAIVGRESVEGRGGKVVRIPLLPGYSSSQLIDKARQH